MTIQVCTHLAGILDKIKQPGDFCTSGRLAIHPPALDVEGVGRIGLPLPGVQARQLIEVAEAAPYGRGTETILDQDYRRTWQIDASQFSLHGDAWQQDLDDIIHRAAQGLGVKGKVEAQPYKLLIYDEGCFFLPHRDSEKTAGMFATLVIVLPSAYQGGELVVEHQGKRMVLDLRQDDPAEVSYAAFYADCRHEVKPVTAGHRLALVFNLVRPNSKRLPRPPRHEPAIAHLAEALNGWNDDGADWLIYPLEHAYTEAELDFANLKAQDRARAEVLAAAAERAGCELYLTLFTIEENGWAEYIGWDDFEIGEVLDSLTMLYTWRTPDGRKLAFDDLPFEPEDLCPPEAWEIIEEQEPEFMEATGNEGASFERIYHGAALVVWPRQRAAGILYRAPLAFSLAYLEERLESWKKARRAADEKATLVTLFDAVIEAWPKTPPYSYHQEVPVPEMATLLARLAEPKVVMRFLERLAERGFLSKDVESLVRLLSLCPTEQKAGLLGKLLRGNTASRPDASARLLRQCLDSEEIPNDTLQPAAEALIAALPTDKASETFASSSEQPAYRFSKTKPDPEQLTALVADLLPALDALSPNLAKAALAHFQANPETCDMDEVLRPAALRLADAPARERNGSVAALCNQVADSLRQRTAHPPTKPSDWRRNAELPCNCSNCQALAQFLANPEQSQWELKAAMAARNHVEDIIRRARCDLDCQTITQGRPYTLRCVKNEASYQRALKRYKQMRADLNHISP